MRSTHFLFPLKDERFTELLTFCSTPRSASLLNRSSRQLRTWLVLTAVISLATHLPFRTLRQSLIYSLDQPLRVYSLGPSIGWPAAVLISSTDLLFRLITHTLAHSLAYCALITRCPHIRNMFLQWKRGNSDCGEKVTAVDKMFWGMLSKSLLSTHSLTHSLTHPSPHPALLISSYSTPLQWTQYEFGWNKCVGRLSKFHSLAHWNPPILISYHPAFHRMRHDWRWGEQCMLGIVAHPLALHPLAHSLTRSHSLAYSLTR